MSDTNYAVTIIGSGAGGGTYIGAPFGPVGKDYPYARMRRLAQARAAKPLTISFGQKELTAIAASVPGGRIAFYQIGYGIAAFGVGPLQQQAALAWRQLFASTAMAALAFVVTSRRDRSGQGIAAQPACTLIHA